MCALECYDLIMVVETWLSAHILNYELNIPGYCLLRRDRNRHGGGVLVYVSSSLPFNTLHHSQDLELLLLECNVGQSKFTFGSFYRPPSSDLSQCMVKLHTILSSLRPANLANLVICGDFNIDANASLLYRILRSTYHHFLVQIASITTSRLCIGRLGSSFKEG